MAKIVVLKQEFTLLEIFLIVLLFSSMFIVIPGVWRMREYRTCQKNLETLRAVKIRWTETRRADAHTHPTWEDLAQSRILPKRPTCPSGGHYEIGQIMEDPRCSSTNGFIPHVLLKPKPGGKK